MVFCSNPVIELVKEPVPVPFVVWLSARVGFDAVLQQTPRDVIATPSSEEMFPPELAVFTVTEEAAVVERTGIPGVKVSSLLFEVPSLFDATSLKWQVTPATSAVAAAVTGTAADPEPAETVGVTLPYAEVGPYSK